MDKFKDFIKKIKGVKHIEIYLAVIVGLIVIMCYFFFTSTPNDTKEENSTGNYSTAQEYADYLENKLCNVLSKISGVGNVSAIITLETGFTYEYATDTETDGPATSHFRKTVKAGGVT